MHAAAHRAQMKDMLDEKKREEEGKEIRHQRVVAKMQKKIDFLEDELLWERQLSRSLTDALLKGRAQYASSSASAAEPKPRRATFLAEVDTSQPSTSKQQSCHFGAAATSPGIVFESLDGKVQKIAMQDIWVNSVFENDPAIEFVTLEQATSQAQASGEKQPAATAASHDLAEILLDAAVEDPEENLPDAAAEDSEEDLPDAAVQVPQENPPPAVAQAHHLQPSYEYDSDIEFNVVDGQLCVHLDATTDAAVFHNILHGDIVNYLCFSVSYVTVKVMKAFKSLASHIYFTSDGVKGVPA
ncbi:uncharacterized protein LOC121836500 [Ixodes scapularis]|uniref:uncharacterized protein LOC121836500 n=1 Tax=Ixodes scapularis TaxID=6945 RepID=UPI001C3913B4|nr:uncharacterized protein LOC121836500 [Ixodes scapularis]